MQLKGPGVFMPQKVDILVSEDGENYAKKGTVCKIPCLSKYYARISVPRRSCGELELV